MIPRSGKLIFYAKREAPEKAYSYEVASGKTQIQSSFQLAYLYNKYTMPRTFYLPELHPFEHIAIAQWPTIVTPDEQLDWISAVDCMEAWLNRYIGCHYSHWAYHNGTSIDYWQACIAFKYAKHKTLFLLQWT